MTQSILWSITRRSRERRLFHHQSAAELASDKAFDIEQATFNDYMAKPGRSFRYRHRRFADLQTALTKRLNDSPLTAVKCLTMRWTW
ncbi:hypothetical protein ACLK19_20700 [Escherichia coli]